jgi:hypothetical protein
MNILYLPIHVLTQREIRENGGHVAPRIFNLWSWSPSRSGRFTQGKTDPVQMDDWAQKPNRTPWLLGIKDTSQKCSNEVDFDFFWGNYISS